MDVVILLIFFIFMTFFLLLVKAMGFKSTRLEDSKQAQF